MFPAVFGLNRVVGQFYWYGLSWHLLVWTDMTAALSLSLAFYQVCENERIREDKLTGQKGGFSHPPHPHPLFLWTSPLLKGQEVIQAVYCPFSDLGVHKSRVWGVRNQILLIIYSFLIPIGWFAPTRIKNHTNLLNCGLTVIYVALNFWTSLKFIKFKF